jgi:hypothetical protein
MECGSTAAALIVDSRGCTMSISSTAGAATVGFTVYPCRDRTFRKTNILDNTLVNRAEDDEANKGRDFLLLWFA